MALTSSEIRAVEDSRAEKDPNRTPVLTGALWRWCSVNISPSNVRLLCQHNHILLPRPHQSRAVAWPGEGPGCRPLLSQVETTQPWPRTREWGEGGVRGESPHHGEDVAADLLGETTVVSLTPPPQCLA